MASAAVRSLARAASRLFYRVDCVGEVPRTGAVLLLPNHPNALLDPAVIWATAGRDVRFLAKSTLFKTPLKLLLAGARAIPVYRRLDQGADTSRNTETFAAVEQAFADGDAVCVFPEGISHSTGRLVPLRTGAARMALGAERHGTPVAIVPAGLNFDRKWAFRSRVTVVYGRPFSCADLRPADASAEPGAVRALTDRIASHMRRLLVEADPAGDAALVDRVDRLYAAARERPRDPQQRIAQRQVIANGLEQLRAADPQRYREIYLKFRRYDDRMRRFGLRDRHLDWQVTRGDAARFAARELVAALILVPVAAAALVAFAVPYLLTQAIARAFARDADVTATAKVLAGIVVYGAWIALAAAGAGMLAGAAASALVAVALPLLAVAGLFAIERESAVADAVKAWLLLRRTAGSTRERLRRSRSELADVLDDVYRWLSATKT